jgi:4-amino-4-deoxy-L-arabinose transferase-like glycosyltransferase
MSRAREAQPAGGGDARLALALCLLAAALYAFRLGWHCLRGDEAFTAVVSTWSWQRIWFDLFAVEPHPPLYHLLMRGWVGWLGQSEIALRFPSYCAGILLTPLSYAIARQLRRPRVGIWAAALAAINPFLLWQSQDARMYALLAAFSLGSLWLMLKMLRNPRASWGLLAAYTLVTLGALATHYYAVLLLVAENIGLALSLARPIERGARIRRWLLCQAALALVALPWLAYRGAVIFGHSKDWIAAVSLPDFARRILTAFSLGETINQRLAWPWLVLFGALACLGLLLSWRERERDLLPFTVLWAALAAPLIIVFLISLWRPAFDERYLIGAAPVYLFFVAWGLDSLQTRWRAAAFLLFALIAAGSGYAIYGYHYLPQYAKSPDWRGVVNKIVAEWQPGDLIISTYPDPAQEYYNAGRAPFVLLPASFPVDVEGTAAALSKAAAEHPRLWLIPVRADNWDRDGLVETWLARYANQAAEYAFRELRLQLVHTEQRYLGEMTPIGADFGELARLLGYALRVGDRPILPDTAVAPGSIIKLTLYWQALAPIKTDYTVFTHLLDAQGMMRGQKDSPPLQGSYPTSAWQVGERLVDHYEIAVDPAAPNGACVLEVGMYEWPANKRLVVTAGSSMLGQDHIVLTKVQIAR